MKGKVFMSLFALPFAGVGVWMLWSIGGTLHDAWQMRDWVAVEARLTDAGFETRSGEDSDTYKAYASYSYRYGGREYTGNRVGTGSGADNIGDYQQDTGRRLQAALQRGEPIRIYVDPADPAESVIDRDVRWGMVGFRSIFVVVFGGVGFGLLIGGWLKARDKGASDPRYADRPWLLNDDWQTSSVRSGSRASMWAAWGFALFWNAISAFAPFIAWREVVENDNYPALLALLFPLVGIGLLVWAVRRTLEWRRFGAVPVELDPFPGSIGGHVGGTINLNVPFDAATRFQLTLTNIHSYVSGSGKNRSQKEKALWQDTIVAHAEPAASGTRLTFRFDVPEGLHESDTNQDSNYYLWRLNLAADLPGPDLDRDYVIPVYATGQQSRSLSGYAVERARSEQASLDEQAVRGLINLEHGPAGKRMVFPMGRNLGPSLGGLLAGAVFAGAGWFLVFNEGQRVFGGIFGGIGLLVGIACLYAIFNSLSVVKTAAGIRTVRRLLGIPIGGAELRRDEIARLDKSSSMRSQSGGKHTIYYSVDAVDRDGKKHTLGVGFKGESQADAAVRLIAREFGLPVPETEPRIDPDEDPLGPAEGY
jgi:hypothetical protein